MEMLYLNIRRCIPIGSCGKRTEKVDYFLLYSGLLGNIKVQKQRLTLLLAFTLILAPIVNRLGHVILLLYFVEKANPEIWTYVIKFLSASIHKDRGSLNFRPSFFELHPTCVIPYRMSTLYNLALRGKSLLKDFPFLQEVIGGSVKFGQEVVDFVLSAIFWVKFLLRFLLLS